VATLSEKVDDMNKKNAEPQYEDEEGEESSTPQSDDGENLTTCDKRESNNEEESSYGDEVGNQRLVDYTFYHHRIEEAFIYRQPSDLAPSKPTYFNIDDLVARSLADSKFDKKRQEYSITVANAFFASVTLEAFEAVNYKATVQRLFKQVCNNLGQQETCRGI